MGSPCGQSEHPGQGSTRPLHLPARPQACGLSTGTLGTRPGPRDRARELRRAQQTTPDMFRDKE